MSLSARQSKVCISAANELAQLKVPEGFEPDIREAWQDPQVRELLTRVIKDGMFRHSPLLGDHFLAHINAAVEGDLDVSEIYDHLHQLLTAPDIARTFNILHERDEMQRVMRRVAQIRDFIPDKSVPASICDVGCGNGLITTQLAEIWDIPKTKAFGADVYERIAPQPGFTPVQIGADSTIALPSDSVDLALLLMVLHHDEDPDRLLSEVRRILKPEGLLVVREADAASGPEKLFHSVLDHLYYRAYNSLPGVPEPENHQSANHWKDMLASHGFKLERENYPEPDSPIKPIHLLLKK